MGDPFSVTGSAVGVASLGLTLCQGFLDYYDPYKSFDEDVEEVLLRIESLKSLMTALEKVIQDGSLMKTSPTPEPVDLATENVQNCRNGVEKLERMLEKCKRASPPGREQPSRFRNQIDRLLYPFRETTLKKLMETVNWLQSNVDTALELLHITILQSGQGR
ncbi:hypothetical protein BJX64DRAFT_224831 [Aspergillus heterothallicus]